MNKVALAVERIRATPQGRAKLPLCPDLTKTSVATFLTWDTGIPVLAIATVTAKPQLCPTNIGGILKICPLTSPENMARGEETAKTCDCAGLA